MRRHTPMRSKRKTESQNVVYIMMGVGCVVFGLVIVLLISFEPAKNIAQREIRKDKIPFFGPYARAIPVDVSYLEMPRGNLRYRKCDGAEQKSKIYPTLLLLHGQQYNSALWQSLGVLQVFCSKHFSTVAIDLPETGASSLQAPKSDADKAKFVFDVAQMLKIKEFVLVVPSASGIYGLPALVTPPKKTVSKMVGFVALAPVGTINYRREAYRKVKTPVLIAHGEKDRSEMVMYSRKNLGYVPDNKDVIIPGGDHAAFVDASNKFEDEVLRFIEEKKFVKEMPLKPIENAELASGLADDLESGDAIASRPVVDGKSRTTTKPEVVVHGDHTDKNKKKKEIHISPRTQPQHGEEGHVRTRPSEMESQRNGKHQPKRTKHMSQVVEAKSADGKVKQH